MAKTTKTHHASRAKKIDSNQPLLYGGAGIVIGIVFAWALAIVAVNSNNPNMKTMMGFRHNNSQNMPMKGYDDDMTMEQMVDGLRGKSGDEFDKTFLSEMIMHHQGAVDMAQLARGNVKHSELKTMTDEIITAQTKEIQQMKDWQKDWGYGSSNKSMMDY